MVLYCQSDFIITLTAKPLSLPFSKNHFSGIAARIAGLCAS
jgi:hypothetical protein